jgi:hypothetical protein
MVDEELFSHNYTTLRLPETYIQFITLREFPINKVLNFTTASLGLSVETKSPKCFVGPNENPKSLNIIPQEKRTFKDCQPTACL